MQGINPPTPDQLLAAGQQPKAKLEIYVDPYWVNICDGFSFLLSSCDATTDWTGTSLSIDTGDKKEGAGSLKDTVVAPVINTWYKSKYSPAGSWDWSAKKHILFWLKSDRANTAFTYARLRIIDTLDNWKYWSLTFSAGEWTAFKLLLSTGTNGSVMPPNLALINYLEIYFYTADTTPFYKKIDYLRIDDVASGLKGKNYLEDWSISLGGASMTPAPIGGTWSATLFNEDGIFHPQHPDSAYKAYCTTERLARISVGATYGGTDYYWQRIIGYMDEPKFSIPDYRVAISGGDYMKRLQETELRMPNNYWGSTWTTSSIASDGAAGVEKYTNADAMRLVGEVNAVPNWATDECTFDWIADAGGTSVWVGQMITTEVEPLLPTVVLDPVFVPVPGRLYAFKFKYNNEQAPGVDASLRVIVKQQPAGQPWIDLGQIEELYSTSWPEKTLYFTAQTNDPIEIWLEIYESPLGTEFRFDKFSIFEFVPYWERYYELRGHDANEKGVHHVTLKPNAAWEDVWQGEGDEGWDYAEDAEPGPDPPAHPAGIVFFDPNKTVAAGVDNLKIYYYLATAPEDAVARILYLAGVFDPATNVPYVNEAAAKAAMVAAPGYAATGITIDKIWFKPGTTSLEAIKKLCERGNAASVQYVFYFTYDGQPVFKPRPTVGAADFAFTGPEHIASVKTYQDTNEIKNRIIIKGMKQAEPVGHDETRPSVWRGEDSDAGSIGSYGERTLTIDNHLFQTQAPINAMCTALLAKYKDPKWYSDLKIPFNPAPLEIGDSMSWVERLSPILNTAVKTGLIRDIKINNFNTIYKCEV